MKARTVDLRAFNAFKELKNKYTPKCIEITPHDVEIGAGLFRTPKEYVIQQFKKQHNILVDRYAHDYDSLSTATPKIGVVFLAKSQDTSLPTTEAWVLIGHNATLIERIQGEHNV